MNVLLDAVSRGKDVFQRTADDHNSTADEEQNKTLALPDARIIAVR